MPTALQIARCFALGKAWRGVASGIVAESGVSLAARRQPCAATLRMMRQRLRRMEPAERASEGLTVFSMAHAAMFRGGAGWWRWHDDLLAHRLPFDFSAKARAARRVELVARFIDGSLVSCHFGECPATLPAAAAMEAARKLLAGI